MKKLSIARSSTQRSFRPSTFKISSFTLVCALIVLAGCRPDGPAGPNLVLITIDRVAADRLGCFGGPREQGLSVCALAEGGTLFSWAASPGRGEASVVASILTGLPESEHGVGQDGLEFLPDALTTIAEELRDAGYATAAFVTSPRVNASRRLDQGFDLYDDRLASPSRSDATASEALPQEISDWIDATPAPWFLWIHANRDAGLIELDRLLSRLAHTLDDRQNAPGVLFTSLRGEREADNLGLTQTEQRITWRTHRVPLIWRPALKGDVLPLRVSRRLASLLDIAPTLRAAAHLANRAARGEGIQDQSARAKPDSAGRDLGRLARDSATQASDGERFIVLHTPNSDGEVGLASRNHLYTRRSSSLDGSGRPVPMASLSALKARFAAIPTGEGGAGEDGEDGSNTRSARLESGLWRLDVLATDSPVPRLEFHLARGLAPALASSTTSTPSSIPPSIPPSSRRPEAPRSPRSSALKGSSE